MEASFRNHVNETGVRNRAVGMKNEPNVPIPGEKPVTVEVCDLKYPDGNVGTFPADEKMSDGRTFKEAYPAEYQMFKNGGADRARAAVLEAEIKERQDELAALQPKHKAKAEKDEDDEKPAPRKRAHG